MTVENVAFVVVQHLAPHQPSMLTELLGRASALPVVTAEDGARVLPSRVYVTPPDADLSIRNGILHLAPPARSDDRVHLPIDSFFASLAEDRGAHAMGVVLSGTGTDGTHGLEEIKASGGITFVQVFESWDVASVNGGRGDLRGHRGPDRRGDRDLSLAGPPEAAAAAREAAAAAGHGAAVADTSAAWAAPRPDGP